MKVTIYVEGGGDDNSTKTKCRKGFSKFFENATFKGCMPKIIACGSRQQAYKDFCTKLKQRKKDEYPVLLLDSEELILSASKWEHLKNREGKKWLKPKNATEDHVYLMTVCMEAWFMADKEALKRYYADQSFNEKVLPTGSEIEKIPKGDLLSGLEKATHNTQKGKYSKGKHSFEILAQIDPQKVIDSSQKAKEMIDYLKNL